MEAKVQEEAEAQAVLDLAVVEAEAREGED